MFDWDGNNLRKLRAHLIKGDEVKQALLNDPLPVYEQDVEGELRLVYYDETEAGRVLAIIVMERGGFIHVVTAYPLDAGQKARLSVEAVRRRVMSMEKKTRSLPKFKSESDEADWWASPAGRAFLKQKTAAAQTAGGKPVGSGLVASLNKKRSVQIAIRLPESDLAQARVLAERKGVGYQTLLKMFVREGLIREARRG